MRRLILFASMACCLMAGNATAAVMTDYCQSPPFISAAAAPNVLLMVDTSGSMSWKAYSYGDTDANNDGVLDRYVSSKVYEGYFDPLKNYTLDANNVYQEAVGGTCGKTCTGTLTCTTGNTNPGGCEPKGTFGCSNSRWACCTQWTATA